MAASLRELRGRKDSVATTMKITKAMELIASSRVTRAQQKATRSQEYTFELLRAVSMVASYSHTQHPLNVEHRERKRSALLVISSDRGLAGAYPSNVNRAASNVLEELAAQGIENEIYTVGKKAREHFEFRGVPIAKSWEGFSEEPRFEHAQEIGQTLIDRFLISQDEGGVGELHVVFTQFNSLVSNTTRIVRLLPLLIVEGDDVEATLNNPDLGNQDPQEQPLVEYSYEPDADTVLDALMPMYVIDTIKFMLRESAASELASRQQAMHSATDNAKQLIEDLTRQANQARQGEITQEINEIVSGADSLTSSR